MNGGGRLAWTALAACLLLAACRSAPALEARRIPVHVAIVPIAAPAPGRVAPGELEGSETELRLELDAGEVTAALAGALEEYCFARASLLEIADEGPASAVDAFERERALLAEARDLGADWIVELALRYDAEVYREITSTFWLNYPLFLFAGPSNWFLPDNAYFADVELDATIHDLRAIDAGEGTLGDPAAEVLTVRARFGGSELSFTERSAGVVDYAKAILIPSGHLARESEDALEEIRADVLSTLRAQLVQSLQSRRDDLLRAEPVAPLYVEPDDLLIERTGAGLRVEGRVLLRGDGLARRVRAVRLDAGAERVSVEPVEEPLEEPEGTPAGYRAYRFEAPVAAAAEARYLRIECEAGSRDRFVRSYTFRIPSGGRTDR